MTKGKCALMGRKEWQQKTEDKEGFLLQPRCSPTGKAEMEAKQRHLGLIPLGNWVTRFLALSPTRLHFLHLLQHQFHSVRGWRDG